MTWLLAVLGLNSASGVSYLAWSGVIGDLGLLGAVLVCLKHQNCPHRWCWRIGRHPVAGGHFRTCRRHHPVPQPRRLTMDHIRALHDEHQERGQR